jgi:hypothetical protein
VIPRPRSPLTRGLDVNLLERLSPPERAVFVLHEAFDLPYDDIAPIVGAGRGQRPARHLGHRRRYRPGRLHHTRDGLIHGMYCVLNPDKLTRLRPQR